MDKLQKYRFACTLSFGDIYGQVVVWLIVIFLSLAATMALWIAQRQLYAFMALGLVVVLSLPFLLFAFVTTLLNHIELKEVSGEEKQEATASRGLGAQKPASA